MGAKNTTVEPTLFRWLHSLMAYALAGFLIWGLVFTERPAPQMLWVMLLPFLFASLMCRVVSARDLLTMSKEAKDILGKRKPTQGSLLE